MSTTRIAETARVHHALGDLTRLRIARRLLLGDASPGELGEWLGLSSNLVAHHLTTLAAAGIVRRLRSEGDKRRHYVSLVADPLVEQLVAAGNAEPSGGARVRRLAFVCTANSARSQLAAAQWNRFSPIAAVSAGTRPAARVHPRAVAIADRHGLKLDPTGTHEAKSTILPDDLVIAVCDLVHEELPPTLSRLHWAVADPVSADTDDAFEHAFTDLTTRLSRLRGHLTEGHTMTIETSRNW